MKDGEIHDLDLCPIIPFQMVDGVRFWLWDCSASMVHDQTSSRVPILWPKICSLRYGKTRIIYAWLYALILRVIIRSGMQNKQWLYQIFVVIVHQVSLLTCQQENKDFEPKGKHLNRINGLQSPSTNGMSKQLPWKLHYTRKERNFEISSKL